MISGPTTRSEQGFSRHDRRVEWGLGAEVREPMRANGRRIAGWRPLSARETVVVWRAISLTIGQLHGSSEAWPYVRRCSATNRSTSTA